MPNGEGRSVVTSFLERWVETQRLTYKFSVHADAQSQFRNHVHVTFSKPTPAMPAPAAVAHFVFLLDDTLQRVRGFTVESDPHFHDLEQIAFDEALIDRVIRRKLLLKQQNFVNLNDEFSSTRIPAAMQAVAEEASARDREVLEENLLDAFQRKDPYNDGRIPFACFRETLEEFVAGYDQKEILFAFSERDREGMVDYGAFVSIGADVFDTLRSSMYPLQAEAKGLDERNSNADNSDTDKEIVQLFQEFTAGETQYTIEKLEELLHALELESMTANGSNTNASAVEPSGSNIIQEEEEGNGANIDAEDGDLDADDVEDDQLKLEQEKTEYFITFHQLRNCLESPQLLMCKGEINLMMALVDVTEDNRIPTSQLSALLKHIRVLIFEYQRRWFYDRLENYLLDQFKNYESSNLKGSAKHLKMKLTQREIKVVIKDMKKLLLSPYQFMQLVSLCGESRNMDQTVNYKECVPRMVRFLQEQVNVNSLSEKLQIIHSFPSTDLCDVNLPYEGDFIRVSLEKFMKSDHKKLGVLSIDDFYQSLAEICEIHSIQLTEDDVKQLYVIADPIGNGRVNYIYFQQVIYPLVRFILRQHYLVIALQEERRRSTQNDGKKYSDESGECTAK